MKEQLKSLIIEKNVSSLAILSQQLGVDVVTIREMILTMVAEGTLQGRMSEDGSRFFRNDIRRPSPAVPSKGVEDVLPAFMRYNVRPGCIIAVFGLAIIIIALIIFHFSGQDISLENIAFGILLVGLIVMLCGCYYIGRRPTL